MRYAFGLVSLLVCVAIMAWMFANHTVSISKVNKTETERVRQIAGRDETTGEDASRALTLEPAQRGSKVIGVTVTAIVPGSSMEKKYGIMAGDVITQAGDMPLGDPFVSDAQGAAGLILKAFQEFKPLTVTRGGQSITLPRPPGAPAPTASATAVDPFAGGAPAAGGAQAATPPQPAPPANQKQAPTQKGGLQRQLELIQGAGGGQGGDQ